MEIDQRIPDLSDKELERLHANAVRLSQSGSVKQREQAESLLPLVGAAMEARRTAKAALQDENKRIKAQEKADARAAAKAASNKADT